MQSELKKSYERRIKRTLRVRKHVRGTSLKPRLSVVKSNKHILAQLIDDQKGITLGSASTLSKELKTTEFCKKNKASARKIGEQIAEIAKKHNIKEIVFDRGPFKYHGILAELANAVRESGLEF